MSRQPFILFGIFAAICVIVIPGYALSKEGSEEAATVQVAVADSESKQLFANNCGPCHTLAAAGTDGIVGPDLDDILVTSGTNSPEQFSGIYGRTITAVTCGVAGRMPKGILNTDEAREVAAFVGAYAGRIGSGPTLDVASAEKPDPAGCTVDPAN